MESIAFYSSILSGSGRVGCNRHTAWANKKIPTLIIFWEKLGGTVPKVVLKTFYPTERIAVGHMWSFITFNLPKIKEPNRYFYLALHTFRNTTPQLIIINCLEVLLQLRICENVGIVLVRFSQFHRNLTVPLAKLNLLTVGSCLSACQSLSLCPVLFSLKKVRWITFAQAKKYENDEVKR